jgi:hypothetical protein
MAKREAVKPSDVVVWRQSQDGGKWRLHRLGGRDQFIERRPEQTDGDGTFVCWLLNESDDALDPDAKFTLITQGEHKGGRRYTPGLTFAQAQRRALEWLDRRFRVEAA